MSLEISQEVVGPGEPLRMDLTVRNNGLTPVEYWHGGQEYDFWVEGPKGVVWLWSQWMGAEGWAFHLRLDNDTLWPTQERTVTETWHQSRCTGLGEPIAAGHYVAWAIWMATDESGISQGWWSNSVEFEIR